MSIFGPKTVSSAIAPLTKVAKALRAVGEAQVAVIQRNRAEVDRLLLASETANKELFTSSVLATKLEALLDPTPEEATD